MEKKIEIQYTPAKFHRRILANLLDILLFAAVGIGLFLGARRIVQSQSGYIEAQNSLKAIQKESGLYREINGQNVAVVTYLDQEDLSGSAKKTFAVDAINAFFAYGETRMEGEAYLEMIEGYDEYRLNPSFSHLDVPYFILKESKVIENIDCKASDLNYYSNVYAPYIEDILQGYLVSKIPGYAKIVQDDALLAIFAEVVPAYLLAGILVYLVPPLILRRNRHTVGKWIYQIGLAGKDLLSVKTKTYLLRFAIFYFAELILSAATFGIPFIISFSLMAFSKKKQGFPDYLLGLFEVDLTNAKLFFSYDEIRLNELDPSKKAPDFKMIDKP